MNDDGKAVAYALAAHVGHCRLAGCRHPAQYDDEPPAGGWCALCRYVTTGYLYGRGQASRWGEPSLDEMTELDRRMDARYGRGWRRGGAAHDIPAAVYLED